MRTNGVAGLVRIIHDGSSRNREVAKRDGRVEPRETETSLKQSVEATSGEPARQHAAQPRTGLSQRRIRDCSRSVHALCALTVFAAASLLMVEAAPAENPKRGVAVVPQVAAGSLPITGDYWALIIGIDQYQHVPKLQSAVKDAQAVREVLVQRYGFGRDHVIELINGQATRERIENALYEVRKKTGPNDSVFIYYAGHGQIDQEDQIGYWVPVEGKAQSPGTFISNARIRDEIGRMKAKHVYLVADSCFSGTLFASGRALPPLNDKFFQRLYANKSRWGLTSGMNEPVTDQGKDGHSVFAYFFLKLLKENKDPYLVPSHIYDQIAPLIGRNTDQQPRSEPLQNAGDEGGQFVFRLASTSGGPVPAPIASGTGSSDEMAAMKKRLEEMEKKLSQQAKPPKTSESPKVASLPSYSQPKQAGKEAVQIDLENQALPLTRQDVERLIFLDGSWSDVKKFLAKALSEPRVPLSFDYKPRCVAEDHLETLQSDYRQEQIIGGHIRSIREERSSLFIRAGQWTEGERVQTSFIVYGQNGRRARLDESVFGAKLELLRKLSCSYGSSGILLKRQGYKTDGAIEFAETYAYDSGGRLKQIVSVGKDRVPTNNSFTYKRTERAVEYVDSLYGERTLVQYDNGGKIVEVSFFRKDGTIIVRYMYAYDSSGARIKEEQEASGFLDITLYDMKGKVAEESHYDSNGELMSRVAYSYDAKGLLTEEAGFNGDGSPYRKRIHTYKFDDMGNWIKQTIIHFAPGSVGGLLGEPVDAMVIYRTISYY